MRLVRRIWQKFVVATTSAITSVLVPGFHHWLIVAGVVGKYARSAVFGDDWQSYIPQSGAYYR